MNNKLKTLTTNSPPYSTNDYLSLIAGCTSFLETTNQLIGEVEARSNWPSYVWEEVSNYFLNPPDTLGQAIVDLSTDIGNLNLRLQALLIAMDTPEEM